MATQQNYFIEVNLAWQGWPDMWTPLYPAPGRTRLVFSSGDAAMEMLKEAEGHFARARLRPIDRPANAGDRFAEKDAKKEGND